MTRYTVPDPESAPEYTVLPTGDYRARIVEVQEIEGKYGAQLQWQFEIAQGEHQGESVRGWTSTKFGINPNTNAPAKARQWTEAAFQRRLQANEVVDTDELAGRELVLTVAEVEKANGDPTNQILAVKPTRRIPPPRQQDEYDDSDFNEGVPQERPQQQRQPVPLGRR